MNKNGTSKKISGSILLVIAVGLAIIFYFYYKKYINIFAQNNLFFERTLSWITFLFATLGIVLIISGNRDRKRQKIARINNTSKEVLYVKTKNKYNIGIIIILIGASLIAFQYSHYALITIVLMMAGFIEVISFLFMNVADNIFLIGVVVVIIGVVINSVARKRNRKKELEKYLHKSEHKEETEYDKNKTT